MLVRPKLIISHLKIIISDGATTTKFRKLKTPSLNNFSKVTMHIFVAYTYCVSYAKLDLTSSLVHDVAELCLNANERLRA